MVGIRAIKTSIISPVLQFFISLYFSRVLFNIWLFIFFFSHFYSSANFTEIGVHEPVDKKPDLQTGLVLPNVKDDDDDSDKDALVVDENPQHSCKKPAANKSGSLRLKLSSKTRSFQ